MRRKKKTDDEYLIPVQHDKSREKAGKEDQIGELVAEINGMERTLNDLNQEGKNKADRCAFSRLSLVPRYRLTINRVRNSVSSI